MNSTLAAAKIWVYFLFNLLNLTHKMLWFGFKVNRREITTDWHTHFLSSDSSESLYRKTARKKKCNTIVKKKYSFTLFLLNPLSFCISRSQHINSVKPPEETNIKVSNIATDFFILNYFLGNSYFKMYKNLWNNPR